MTEPIAGNPMADDGLIDAATNLTQFAWTAVSADCEESRAYLNSLVDKLRSALARISRPSITADAVAWQRFANVTNPPKWIDIDPAEKEEWERLGYPIRALFAHPAPEGAGYDPTTQPYDEPFRHVVSEGAGERDDKLLYNRPATAGDTEPGDIVDLRAAFDGDDIPRKNIALRKAAKALTSLRAERDEARAAEALWDAAFVDRVVAEHGTTIDILSKRLDEYAARIATKDDALHNARVMLIAFGGDPRVAIREHGSAHEDECQAALLDCIDAALSEV